MKVIRTNDDNVYPYFCIAPPSNPHNQNFHWISHSFDDSTTDRGLSIFGDPQRPSVHAGNDGCGPGTARSLFRARGPGPRQHPNHPAPATPAHVHNFCAKIPWTLHWSFLTSMRAGRTPLKTELVRRSRLNESTKPCTDERPIITESGISAGAL